MTHLERLGPHDAWDSKPGITRWFRANTDIDAVWQRNHYKYIIRTENAYLKIAEYAQTNLQRWETDTYYT